MNMDIGVIAQVLGILVTSCTLIKMFIINPLRESIDNLGKKVESLEKVINTAKDDQHSIDKRLVAVESSVKQAHKRLDKVEGKTWTN